MSVTIKNTEKDGKGIFEAYVEGSKAGEMTYVRNREGILIIDHTEVASEFGGRGIGKQLIEAGVAYARTRHMKIIPLCPFAARVMDGKEIYKDILA